MQKSRSNFIPSPSGPRSSLWVKELELLMGKQWVLTNLSWRNLVYNSVANAALYLFYTLVPYSEFLQRANRQILWRLFWY